MRTDKIMIMNEAKLKFLNIFEPEQNEDFAESS